MKYVLVTGSTRGIGKAIAEVLEAKGYTVIRNGRGECSMEKPYIQADLSTEDGMNKLVEELSRFTNQLDGVILNVGTTCRKEFREITYQDLQTVMDTNVNIPFLLSERLYEHMAKDGCILFISSAMALTPHATSIPYGMSKAAVNMMAQCLVKEYAPLGVRVNVICPGFISTEWQKEKPEWLWEKIERKIALNRFGSPEEIAHLCVALCENTYVNGAIVSVDGGYGMIH